MKDVQFVGSSLDDLRAFPKAPKQDLGRQIERVQRGLDPLDWKPMTQVGRGVREIRIRDKDNNYRGICVTNIGDAVYVLHVFRKQSQKTPARDIEKAKSRLKALRAQLRKGEQSMKIHSYRSVWDAIADSPEEAAHLKLRAQLMDALKAYLAREGITQAEAAQRLGVPRSRVSELVNDRISKFTIDKLVDMAARVGLRTQITVRHPAISSRTPPLKKAHHIGGC